MITKITRRNLRKIILREVKRLNESGMGDIDTDIQLEIVDYIKQGYGNNDNNINGIANHILSEFPDYFDNFTHCKNAIIEILSQSQFLRYSERFRTVMIRDEMY